MKKGSLMAAALAFCLLVCACGSSGGDYSPKKNAYPLYFNGTKALDLPLCFLDGVNDLPYIEAGDMIDFYKELYVLDGKPVQMTVAKNGAVVTCVRKNEVYKVDAFALTTTTCSR